MVHEEVIFYLFLSRDLELTEFKKHSFCVRISLYEHRLLSMKHWDVFYSDQNELKRYKRTIRKSFRRITLDAGIDKFQHWICTTKHSSEERKQKWIEIDKELETK